MDNDFCTQYLRVVDMWCVERKDAPPPCGVVLVDVWCDERKGWNQHERAGEQHIDVTQREGDWKEKWLF